MSWTAPDGGARVPSRSTGRGGRRRRDRGTGDELHLDRRALADAEEVRQEDGIACGKAAQDLHLRVGADADLDLLEMSDVIAHDEDAMPTHGWNHGLGGNLDTVPGLLERHVD